MKISVTIPELNVFRKGERIKEIYVAGVIMQEAEWREPRSNPVGALCRHKELPAAGAHESGGAVFCTEIFHGIRTRLSLTGSGIMLFPPAEPGEYLSIHFVVAESDAGLRRSGQVLGSVFDEAGDLASVASGLEPVRSLGKILANVLKRNKDDLLLSHHHSCLQVDGYDLGGGESRDYRVRNDRVDLVLRTRLGPGEAREEPDPGANAQ